ncbi:hypothetical protein HVPorG_04200 [Roseomonas mucosa]|uniref:Uncharacterized protein n=1 Tax=Roseomonas mucosa TaxID=207340 RepID=A0A4Y1MTZ0_9PROT|nr:hypothetical protein RADP37_04200 [Roseomonas mucosa]QDD93581.1 hypothetical protein HVIM_04200 [Roseomonas mucosa]QDD98685.1 hypothetical protein ADP8_04200 [Roseomonas mucosa]QDJ08337.1 hypothetical protein HVPorG_04200 [Roseomonas mucosa]UZO90881.1 hypothetical protein RMP42_04200 [Roseomonas mucosa]
MEVTDRPQRAWHRQLPKGEALRRDPATAGISEWEVQEPQVPGG